MIPAIHKPKPLTFTKLYDAAVLGAGYMGFAAANRLYAEGKQVLLIEPSGQVLWESTACLVNELQGKRHSTDWSRWIAELELHNGIANDKFDPVVAEILAMHKLREWMDNGHGDILFYCYPVGVEHYGSQITTLLLATKAGVQRVHARQWIDTTEHGDLLRIATGRQILTQQSEKTTWRIALQSKRWESIEAPLREHALAHGMRITPSAKKSERHLCWDEPIRPWHKVIIEKVGMLRESYGEASDFVISHCVSRPYTVYSPCASQKTAHSELRNLICLSPAANTVDLRQIPDRYAYGMSAAWYADRLAPVDAFTIAETPELTDPGKLSVDEECQSDVFVAGAGTAGSLAAIMSAQQGAKTTAIDLAAFPGGVGTVGGITGYFYGIGGDELRQIDAMTDKMNALLMGTSLDTDAWHQDAKKLAILELFETSGVSFHGDGLLLGIEANQGHIETALVAYHNKLIRFKAQSFIDSTGDGDLCAYAGATFTSGRSGDGRNLAYSQAALVIDDQSDPIKLKSLNFDAGWLDPTNPIDLTRARLVGVEQYLQSHVFQDGSLIMTAPLPGIRQSRHIETEYILQLDDLVSQRQFEDSIGEASCHADSHSVDFEFEDDEMVFYYWVCRLFRHPLHTQLPYRMLLPKSLENVWIACRAAGMSNNAFYAIRMQRDMQRLGAVAGAAAAKHACNGSTNNHSRYPSEPQQDKNNFRIDDHPIPKPQIRPENPVKDLERGQSGLSLWRIAANRNDYYASVIGILKSTDRQASFYAACILAKWSDPKAEPRLIQAIIDREIGDIDPTENPGAYGQEIDIPFWLIAVIMLRCCGTRVALPVLLELANDSSNTLNIRTSLALTAERLLQRSAITSREAIALLDKLIASPVPDAEQLPSRSFARAIRKETQLKLPNDCGVDTRQDHTWQLHLIVCRVRTSSGLVPQPEAFHYAQDYRAHVRQSFSPHILATPAK